MRVLSSRVKLFFHSGAALLSFAGTSTAPAALPAKDANARFLAAAFHRALALHLLPPR